VQLGTVRYLGRFLEDPCTVPEQVVRWVAHELGVDPSGLGAYARGEGAGTIRRRSGGSTATASSTNPTSSSSWRGGWRPGRGCRPRATGRCLTGRSII
jgi:hypothetical protein